MVLCRQRGGRLCLCLCVFFIVLLEQQLKNKTKTFRFFRARLIITASLLLFFFSQVTRSSKTVQAYVARIVGLLRAVATGEQGLPEATRAVAGAMFPRLDLHARQPDLVTA